MVRWKEGILLWALMFVYPGLSSHLVRERRVLNEPGDVQQKGNGIIPSNKRQQIIYLLNKDGPTKRDQQPANTTKMEKYAKELTVDGRVVTMTTLPSQAHSFAFYGPSEELHGRGFKEVAVNKGDGPPKLRDKKPAQKMHQQSGQQKPSNVTSVTAESNKTVSPKRQQILNPVKQVLRVEAEHDAQGVQKSVINNNVGTRQSPVAEELSSKSRVKNSYIRTGMLPDGEILLPRKRIEPNVFSISQSDIKGRDRYSNDEFNSDSGDHSTVLLPGDEPPERAEGPEARWDVPRRRYHHRYHHHRHRRPVVLSGRPDMYYMPMYSGHSQLQMVPFTPGQGMMAAPPGPEDGMQGFPTAGYRQQVMLQPLVQVPMVQPQQGVPYVPTQSFIPPPYEQPDVRPALLAAVPSQPQFVYPMAALPSIPDPLHQQEMPQEDRPFEQELQQQQGLEQEQLQRQREDQEREFDRAEYQESRLPLATRWVDEPGRARSSVDEVPTPDRIPEDRLDEGRDSYYREKDYRYYDDRRADDMGREDRYHGFRDEYEDDGRSRHFRGGLRYHEDRDGELVGREPMEDYRGQAQPEEEQQYGEENAIARSDPPKEEDNEGDDDDEESESEDSQAALQDSREERVEREDKPEPSQSIDLPQPSPEPSADRMSSLEGMVPNPPEQPEHEIPPISSPEGDEAPAVIRIPARPDTDMMMPHSHYHQPRYRQPFSANALEREQLLGSFSPVHERVLPRLQEYSTRRTPMVSPNAEVSEMSESEARFKERMQMEMAADTIPLTSKDTIPKGLGDLKNTIIRLNGKPLENGSELRSRIVHGRIVRGRGKVITSKGPINIKVSHTKGRRKMKIIDIISPQQFHVSDARSRIGSPGLKPKTSSSTAKGSTASTGKTAKGNASTNIKRVKLDNIDRVASILAERILRKSGSGGKTLKANLERLKL